MVDRVHMPLKPRANRANAATTAVAKTLSEGRKPDSQSALDDVLRQLDAQAEGPEQGSEGYAEFELDFELALARQLGPFFEKLPPLRLTPENIERVVKAKARGAYYLLLEGEIVYIGKSDARAGLRVRLLRHYKTLKRRKGIDWSEMKFKAVKVSSLAALDTESLLLDLYKRKAKILSRPDRPDWNFSGFGSNDTGVERDTQRVSVFDQRYPLDLNAPIRFEAEPAEKVGISLDKYLKWLAGELQFVFRRQATKTPREKSLAGVTVDFASMTANPSLRDLLLAIHRKLPDGWVLTVLRGKLVLYLNDRRTYKSPVWRLEAGQEAGAPNYSLGDIGDATLDDEEDGQD